MRSVRVCVWIRLALSLPAGAAAQGRQTGAGDPDLRVSSNAWWR